jgi:hypothetical protein
MASAGFEHAKFGPNGKHANDYTTEAIYVKVRPVNCENLHYVVVSTLQVFSSLLHSQTPTVRPLEALMLNPRWYRPEDKSPLAEM